MKISLIAGRFGLSGVPLAQSRLARELAARGHDVDLIYGQVNPGHELPKVDGVHVSTMDSPRVSGMLLRLIRYLHSRQPDVIFSAGDHLNAIVLLAGIFSWSKAKISCSSRVTPFHWYSSTPFTKGWILKLIMRAVMPRADALTCVSIDMVQQYRQIFRNARHVCVYNIIDDATAGSRMNEAVEEEWLVDKTVPVIVAAGSLEPWKGFDELITAMGELQKTKRARLLILGEGPLREALQTQIARMSLGDSVKLLGNVENPLKYFSRSDVFALSSHVEGLPNVLVEAMLCGCTPVATNCPTGPREVLQDGKIGFLVPVSQPRAMAAALSEALERPLPKKVLRDAVRGFSADQVIERHFDILGIRERAVQHSGSPSR